MCVWINLLLFRYFCAHTVAWKDCANSTSSERNKVVKCKQVTHLANLPTYLHNVVCGWTGSMVVNFYFVFYKNRILSLFYLSQSIQNGNDAKFTPPENSYSWCSFYFRFFFQPLCLKVVFVYHVCGISTKKYVSCIRK